MVGKLKHKRGKDDDEENKKLMTEKCWRNLEIAKEKGSRLLAESTSVRINSETNYKTRYSFRRTSKQKLEDGYVNTYKGTCSNFGINILN